MHAPGVYFGRCPIRILFTLGIDRILFWRWNSLLTSLERTIAISFPCSQCDTLIAYFVVAVIALNFYWNAKTFTWMNEHENVLFTYAWQVVDKWECGAHCHHRLIGFILTIFIITLLIVVAKDQELNSSRLGYTLCPILSLKQMNGIDWAIHMW